MLAPFHQFMKAIDRDIERRKFNPNITYAELHAMTPEDQRQWWRDLREHWSRGNGHFDFFDDGTSGDYDVIDSRRRHEFGE